MFVKLDERNRLTLPKDLALLFVNGLVDVRQEDQKLILEPVTEPFSKVRGMIKDKRSILALKRKLDHDIQAGRWGL